MTDAGKRPRILSERRGRWLLNLYPPLLFNRIRILEIGPGFRSCRVRVRRSLLTRNLHGSIFGGTIFSAADPFHAVLYWQVLARRGEAVQVWLERAAITYSKPAKTPLTLEFSLSDDDVEGAVAALHERGRFRRTFTTRAVDEGGDVCAEIEIDVYLRRHEPEPRDIEF